MPTPPLSDAAAWEAVKLVIQYGSCGKAARALGVPRETLRRRLDIARTRWPNSLPPSAPTENWATAANVPETPPSPRRMALKGEVGGPPIPPIAKPPEGFIIERNAGAYDAEGNLLRQWVGTRRDAGEVYGIPVGHTVKGESALLDPEGRLLAKWVKTREGAGEGLIDALKKAFSEYDGNAGVIPAPKHSDDDILTVYPLPDLHLGQYSYKEETGADYDTEIAIRIATESIATLVSQSRPSKKAVILGLGDLFHANDTKAVTPGSGNRLDVDTRWSRTFAAGAKLMVNLVDLVAKKHTDIHLCMIPGNHDPDASISITVALALFYSKNARVKVWQDPGIAWYYRFGKVLLGATHGHTMKPDRMAMMMAADRPEDWGQTLYRYMYSGHIHRETASEIGPVRVESFSSPAARDAWNASSGYRSSRALSAITHHREDGEIGRHRVNILNP